MGRLGADASRVVEAARDLARKHRHETLEPEHLLGALVSDARMVGVLTEHAVDHEDLGERVSARLVDWPTSGLYRDARVEPVPSVAFESLIARAGAGRALVRSAGESIDDDTLPDDGDEDVDIVFHDDDYTTMELVIQVLNQCFAIPADEAVPMMLRVHGGGAQVVKTCPASEARWRLERGRTQARQAGMPLRIAWRHRTISREPEHDDA